MNQQETIQILLIASALDSRLSRRNDQERLAMAQMWQVALENVPFDFAKNEVVRHYRVSSEALMPANIAIPWNTQQAIERDKTNTKALLGIPRGNGMPADVRATLTRLGLLSDKLGE